MNATERLNAINMAIKNLDKTFARMENKYPVSMEITDVDRAHIAKMLYTKESNYLNRLSLRKAIIKAIGTGEDYRKYHDVFIWGDKKSVPQDIIDKVSKSLHDEYGITLEIIAMVAPKFDTVEEEVLDVEQQQYIVEADMKGKSIESVVNKFHISSLIFDYPLNSYAEEIKNNFIIRLKKSKDNIEDPWWEKYKDSSFEDPKIRTNAAKDFVHYCNMPINRKEAYKFIFWSLMILTVDDREKEKHLSIICDFARMLHISDEEMEDLVTVIKIIYGNGEGKRLKSKMVKDIFSLASELISWGDVIFPFHF